MEKYYALYTGRVGEYDRDFGNGNRITLRHGAAKQISKEVFDILQHQRNVVTFREFDDGIIEFSKRTIRENWSELVRKHGVNKAKEVRSEQDERIRQEEDSRVGVEGQAVGSTG